MARPVTAARRYAEAAFEIAERDGTVEAWLAQLERAATATADPGTVRRLEDPAVPFDVRRDALLHALGDDLLAPVSNLLELVLRRRRVQLVGRISRELRRLYNRRQGITEATAVSASQLDDVDVRALRERIERLAGGPVELRVEIDPSLIGGLQLRLGDRLIDGSVRGRLERLRNRLVASA
jgi:F-type H+-transporting ATPase subunit delta